MDDLQYTPKQHKRREYIEESKAGQHCHCHCWATLPENFTKEFDCTQHILCHSLARQSWVEKVQIRQNMSDHYWCTTEGFERQLLKIYISNSKPRQFLLLLSIVIFR